jgi:LysR family transcriptional regulator, regulator for bpeEF and oprC
MPIMDRFDIMRVFVRVAETGSFTKTADDMRLPRATVSMAVQQLEASLGTRLLHRTTRRVQLTQDGTALLERCRVLLVDVEEIEGLFRQNPTQVAGKLKVDVPSRLGRMLIAPALPDFFARYPNIELELGVTDRTIDLVQEGVDCVIRAGNLEDSSLVSRRLTEFDMVSCVSSDYVARHGMPQSIDDLATHWAVNYLSPTTGRLFPWQYMENGVEHHVEMKSHVTVNNSETYLACCQSGLGMIQVPLCDVIGHFQTGELLEIMPHLRPPPMPLNALYPHRRHLSRRVQAFIEWLEKLVKRMMQDVQNQRAGQQA